MSDHQQPDRQRLPLPEPRSPRALDERILARARDAAPQRSGWSRPAWAGSLVTASVIGISLLISEPDQPAPVLDAPAYSVEKEISAFRAGSATPPAAVETIKGEPPRSGMGMLQDNPADSADMSLQRAEQRAARPANAKTLSADFAAMEERALAPAPQASAKLSAASLETCLELLEGGAKAKAQTCYKDLLKTCPDCGLPETLQEAATALPATAEQAPPAGTGDSR